MVPLLRRALKVLTDREVSPQLGLLKSTMLQLDSTFSERTYGASTFRDFAEKLAAAGVVTLKESGRNILVELKDDGRADRRAAAAPVAARAVGGPPAAGAAAGRRSRTGVRRPPRGRSGRRSAAPVPAGAAAAALADVRPPGEAVPARRRSDVRRAEVRVPEPERPAARLPEGRPVPDGARSPGRDPLLPGQRDEGGRRPAHRRRSTRPTSPPPSGWRAQAEAELAAAEAREREAEVVEGDVVRETEAQPIVDAEEAAAPAEAGRASELEAEEPAVERPAARGSRRRPAATKAPRAAKESKAAKEPREKKSVSKPRGGRTKKVAVAADG